MTETQVTYNYTPESTESGVSIMDLVGVFSMIFVILLLIALSGIMFIYIIKLWIYVW